MRSRNLAGVFLGILLTLGGAGERVSLLKDLSLRITSWVGLKPGPSKPNGRRIEKAGNTSDPNGTPNPPGP